MLRLVKFFDKSEILCISPIAIPNVNAGARFLSEHFKATHDCTSKYIFVPCGYCKECIAVKQMYYVQRMRMEALHSFLYFTTLTYDNDSLPRLGVSSGYDIPFADVHHLQLLMKRLRNNNSFGRPFRYFAVSERGSERGRPHFHIVWFLPRYDGEDFSSGLSLTPLLYDSIKSFWATNVGSLKKPVYQPLFTYARKFYRGKMYTNYDTHFVVPNLTNSGYNSVAFYCCKYLFKVSNKEKRLQQALRLNLPDDEYEYVWPIVKSKCFASPSFGLGSSLWNNLSIVNYIRDCVKRSNRSLGYPQFFNPDSNDVFPLAPFYKSRGFLCPQSVMDTFKRDSVFVDFDKSSSEIQSAVLEYDRVSSIVEKDLSVQFDFLFE